MEVNQNIMIVGAGPTGLMLGCLLLQHHIPCRVIDQLDSRNNMTRAIGVTTSTLKLFNDLGILDKFTEQSILTDKIAFYWYDKNIINVYPKEDDQKYSHIVYSKQPIIEKLLEEKFYELGGKIEWGTQLHNVEKEKEFLKLTCSHTNNTKHEYCTHIVGCDGGNSAIRKLIDVKYDREDYNAYFLLVDAEIENDNEFKHACYHITDDGYVMLIPIPDQQIRIIQSFNGTYPDNFHNMLNNCQIESLISKRTGRSVRLKKLIWKTSAPFRHQIVLQPSQNNIALAGDALHIFSPIGGTNMNFGFQDATALLKCFMKIANGQNSNDVWQEYNNDRLSKMYKNLHITRKSTYVITRNEKRDMDFEGKFLPKFANRNFIKRDLFKNFSLVG